MCVCVLKISNDILYLLLPQARMLCWAPIIMEQSTAHSTFWAPNSPDTPPAGGRSESPGCPDPGDLEGRQERGDRRYKIEHRRDKLDAPPARTIMMDVTCFELQGNQGN